MAIARARSAATSSRARVPCSVEMTVAPKPSAPRFLAAGASMGITIVTGMPSASPAAASPCAKLPDE